jgi:ATP-binding cassette subfamily B protein
VRGTLSVGGLVAVFDLLWFVVANLNALSKVVPPMQRASGGMARIQEVLGAREGVADRPGAKMLPPFGESIRFDNVHYGYAGSRVLEGIQLTIRRGESVLIVGPSGSGKSTLLALLLRMDDPVIGSVSIDGHDLRDVTQVSLRTRMGVVFQDSFLFDATVRENIRFGNPEASDAAIEAAARDAGIHDVIAALPNGYDTRLGGGAASLSGGERQRVAIARALVRQPEILILDEPASALDAQAEAAINRTLRHVAKGRTVIAVTHRLAPAATDRILVMSAGRLVEDGSHAQLLARDGVYARLWAAQHHAATVE